MTTSHRDCSLEIRRLHGADEAHVCAQLMSSSEPWTTLQRTYDDSIAMLDDPVREVYVGVVEERVVGFLILRMDGAFVGYIQTVAVEPSWRGQGGKIQYKTLISMPDDVKWQIESAILAEYQRTEERENERNHSESLSR